MTRENLVFVVDVMIIDSTRATMALNVIKLAAIVAELSAIVKIHK
jgi:hypothetical protein